MVPPELRRLLRRLFRPRRRRCCWRELLLLLLVEEVAAGRGAVEAVGGGGGDAGDGHGAGAGRAASGLGFRCTNVGCERGRRRPGGRWMGRRQRLRWPRLDSRSTSTHSRSTYKSTERWRYVILIPFFYFTYDLFLHEGKTYVFLTILVEL
uniref:Uncharacterized protein n=1 Tax=Arundo donax TaxID=35708 RepID=A0A0A9GVC0_ARUDO